MLNFLKSKERKQKDIIYEIMKTWHSGCIASVDNKELLKEPRVIVGMILFFSGSIDNLCQSANFDDKEFGVIAIDILEKLGYPKEVPIPILLNFHNPKKKRSEFALEANSEGGKSVGRFLDKRDPMACFIFSNLVKAWAEKPEMTKEDLSLFGMEE